MHIAWPGDMRRGMCSRCSRPIRSGIMGKGQAPRQLTRRDPDLGDRGEQTFRDLPWSLFPRPPSWRTLSPSTAVLARGGGLHVPGLEGEGGRTEGASLACLRYYYLNSLMVASLLARAYGSRADEGW